MKLDIEPLSALCDQRVDIRVSGLAPSAKVKMSAAMTLPWAKNLRYESFADFTGDLDGT